MGGSPSFFFESKESSFNYMTFIKIVFFTILITNICHSFVERKLKKKAYLSTTWKSLLHFKKGRFYHKDRKFLLSYDNPSLLNELKLTISFFKKDALFL